jgi:hypothetical protein
MMRANDAQFFINHYKTYLEDGRKVLEGVYSGSGNWEWGNYTYGSPFGKYIRGEVQEPKYDYVEHDDAYFSPGKASDYAGFIVFTHEQDKACGNCLGW